jgi:pullulanase
MQGTTIIAAIALGFAPVLCAQSFTVDACAGTSMKTLYDIDTSANHIGAHAIAIDGSRLRWPDVNFAAGDQFKLYASDSAALKVARGQSVRDFDQVIQLAIDSSPLDPALATRISYLGEAGVTLRLPSELRLDRQLIVVQENARGVIKDASHMQLPFYLDARFAQAQFASDLGVSPPNPIEGSARFALWAPSARHVGVCVFSDANKDAYSVVNLQMDAATGIWRSSLADQATRQTSLADQATRQTSLANQATRQTFLGKPQEYYQFLVDVYVPNVGMVRNRVSDPYSITLNANGVRSQIADLNAADYQPAGWESARRAPRIASATDQMIYELHVRDFSANDQSVPAALRGKYLAFAQADSLGSKHLRALASAGMTDVHLLPVFDYSTVPEVGCEQIQTAADGPASENQQASQRRAQDCFNWGYDPQHFGAPEGSFASDANDGAVRVREFRAMVMALHSAGLRVGMDVVYNHTSHAGQHEKSVLDRIVPGYYQRLNSKGEVERSTCCDNTATEHMMMAKLMEDTLLRWVRDYRIDSFRFDLMGHQPKAAMQRVQQLLDAAAGQRVHLLGEGWNFGEVANNARFAQAAQLQLAGSGIASFSDRARDAARGGGCCDGGLDVLRRQGFLNGLYLAPNAYNQADSNSRTELFRAIDLIRTGLAGSIRDYSLETFDGQVKTLSQIDYAGQPAGYVAEPTEIVNYVENHDNPTLFDINALKLPLSTSAEERARVQILGAALISFSQGIGYFHAGMEGLRSKSLDRNSYDSGDWFNRLDWRFQTNYFATGLPPREENGSNFTLFAPVLKRTNIAPSPSTIAWTRDAFLDLLRIRKQTPLLRLPTAELIRTRLQFVNTGPQQIPGMVGAIIDGEGLNHIGYSRVSYWINASLREQIIKVPTEAKRAYRVHPLHQADRRAKLARFDQRGRFIIPARTAVVFVVQAQ